MKKYYDFIFGIGEACSCTQILRRAGLQEYSYPLDWLFGLEFIDRVDIVTNEFKDFFNKEDLEYRGEDKQSKAFPCDVYFNKRTKIGFNHDFVKGTDFESSYHEIKEKYDRRVQRLLDNIKKAETILVVYMEVPSKENKLKNEDILKEGYQRLIKKFPDKKINLLYLSNETGVKFTKIIEVTSDISKVAYDYKCKKEKALHYAVDNNGLKKFFQKHYSLNISIFKKMKNYWNRKIKKCKKIWFR